MKQFLAEYGMIWVGDQQQHHGETASHPTGCTATALPPKPVAPSKLDQPSSSSSNGAGSSAAGVAQPAPKSNTAQPVPQDQPCSSSSSGSGNHAGLEACSSGSGGSGPKAAVMRSCGTSASEWSLMTEVSCPVLCCAFTCASVGPPA